MAFIEASIVGIKVISKDLAFSFNKIDSFSKTSVSLLKSRFKFCELRK